MMTIYKRIDLFHLLVFLLVFLLKGCKEETPIGKWKNGEVPYYLSGNFSDSEVSIIRRAMDDWEAVADVKFTEVTPRAGTYHIIKVNENAWSSSVGEANSEGEMQFGSGGDIYTHVLHELGHALGLLHEHQRPDRDTYVTVYWDNIISQYFSNFEKKDNPLFVEEDYPYDYRSIMHYPKTGFSIDGSSTTIESTDPENPIDRLGKITALDAAKVVDIYGPAADN